MLDLWQFLRIIADRPTYVVQLVAEGWILFYYYYYYYYYYLYSQFVQFGHLVEFFSSYINM